MSFLLLLLIAGLVREPLLSAQTQRPLDHKADLVVLARSIWTGNPRQPAAQALAVRHGEIVFVGSRADAAAWISPETRVIDAPSGHVLPGLIDAHAHLVSLGTEAFQLDLRGAANLDEVITRLRDYAKQHPGEGWITGQNWDQSLWPGMEFPTAAILDGVLPDRPVWLKRIDGHAGWANSAALKRARVSDHTQPPPGGAILRDAAGKPSGVLVDEAMSLVTRVIPDPSESDVIARILEAQRRCLEAGLTGVHDAGVSPQAARLFRRLDQEGRLKLRVYGMASVPEAEALRFLASPPEPVRPSARFQLRAIKLFADGAMGSRGALLFEPYADDPGNAGLSLIEPELLLNITREALKNGWQVCTHAIGDRANALVLDAYLAALADVPAARDPRLRIEHAQVVRKADVARFAQGRIIASMQPAHAASDMRWADARLGAGSERIQGAYAWSWFREAGVSLAFGSDFPVEVQNPFWGIYAALTRQDAAGNPRGGWIPQHRLPLDLILAAYTSGAAYAAFEERRLGTLQPGFRADFILIDRDLATSSPEAILQTRVTHTVIDGEIVHARP
jgi:predicted amidohydrolase YtcJ